MLISDGSVEERQFLMQVARDSAARFTEEKWNWMQCSSKEELKRFIDQKIHADLFCVDITMDDVIPSVIALRGYEKDAYLILVADLSISPLSYMRPNIHAESLLLKPLQKTQVVPILREAVSTYAQRFADPDEEKVFVVDVRGSRDLISYDRILYFESREKKVFLVTEETEYGFGDTLDRLNEELGDSFIRCHRSFLVNKSKIRQVYISQNRVVLSENVEVPLSRSYKPAIKQFLEGGSQNAAKELDSIL